MTMAVAVATSGEGAKQRLSRFSGHETFACRYSWLPKAYRGLSVDPALFSDDDAAMVQLGLGKNMVRSLRFWVEATGLAEADGPRGMRLTDFAHEIFDENGFDPFLEDVRTSWLIHWKLSSRGEGGMFAWHYLLHNWPHPEFTKTEALAAFVRESDRLGHAHSTVTLAQHLDIFLRTYVPGRSAAVGVEDSLDGALIELGFLQQVGQRKGENGRWEPALSFRRESKPEVVPALFAFCLHDYWNRFRSGEETLTLREAALGFCSPGQIFKLPEDDVRSRLETYAGTDLRHGLSYRSSAVQGLVTRNADEGPSLADVYSEESDHV